MADQSMDNLSLQKTKEFLDKNDTIGVAVGKNPTLDEMGAALALYLSLIKANKKVTIVSPTQPIVELSSLVGIDKVKNAFEGGNGDLIVSFPYKEGEIEKVSYTLDNLFLNIVVKTGEQGLSFDEKDVRYKRAGSAPQMIFVIGTPRLSDLGSLYDAEALKDTIVVNIDNKDSNQGFGDIAMVSGQYSSVSEQVAALLTNLNLEIDIDIAQNLMSGISFATDNLQDPQTSPVALEMAGMLIRRGAQRLNALGVSTPQPVQQIAKKQPSKTIDNKKPSEDQNPPEDWLAPKIYKGSTSI